MYCDNCGENLGGARLCPKCYATAGLAPAGRAYSPLTVQSGLAVAALVCVFFIPLLGLILGYVARADIRNSRGSKTGEGMATAAIVLGWVFIILGVLVGISLANSEAFWSGFNSSY